MMPDPERLVALLRRLPPEDAALVRALIEPLRERQAWRHTVRNAAVCEALSLLTGKPTVKAAELQRIAQ